MPLAEPRDVWGRPIQNPHAPRRDELIDELCDFDDDEDDIVYGDDPHELAAQRELERQLQVGRSASGLTAYAGTGPSTSLGDLSPARHRPFVPSEKPSSAFSPSEDDPAPSARKRTLQSLHRGSSGKRRHRRQVSSDSEEEQLVPPTSHASPVDRADDGAPTQGLTMDEAPRARREVLCPASPEPRERTVDSRPSTLDPRPSTLDYRPSTLGHRPHDPQAFAHGLCAASPLIDDIVEDFSDDEGSAVADVQSQAYTPRPGNAAGPMLGIPASSSATVRCMRCACCTR